MRTSGLARCDEFQPIHLNRVGNPRLLPATINPYRYAEELLRNIAIFRVIGNNFGHFRFGKHGVAAAEPARRCMLQGCQRAVVFCRAPGNPASRNAAAEFLRDTYPLRHFLPARITHEHPLDDAEGRTYIPDRAGCGRNLCRPCGSDADRHPRCWLQAAILAPILVEFLWRHGRHSLFNSVLSSNLHHS